MAELASAAPTSGGVSYPSFTAIIYVLTYMRDVRYDVFSSTFGPTRSPHLDGETCSLGLSAVSLSPRLFASPSSRLFHCSVSPFSAPLQTASNTRVSNSLSLFPAPFLLPFLYPILSLLRRPLNLYYLASISYPPAAPHPLPYH